LTVSQGDAAHAVSLEERRAEKMGNVPSTESAQIFAQNWAPKYWLTWTGQVSTRVRVRTGAKRNSFQEKMKANNF
jgi:hypothetical protein